MAKKLTNEDVDLKLYELYKGEYIRMEDYINVKTEINFKHTKCNSIITAKPFNLFNYKICEKCYPINYDRRKTKKNTSSFKKDIKELYNDEYTLLSEFESISKKVIMRHNKCGHEWEITYKNFIYNKRGCPLCGGNIKKSIKEVQEILDSSYGNNEFTVISDKYINKDTPLRIKHNKCGNIIYGSYGNIRDLKFNCEYCNNSSGEYLVSNILNELNIDFVREKKFKDCINKKELPFDFYFEIDNSKYIIEYDGRHHFLPIFGYNDIDRNNTLEKTKINDTIKNQYCIENNINLLRIKYTENENIGNIITNFIMNN